MALKYLPDYDPQTPDVLTGCSGYVPTVKGYEALSSAVARTTALSAAARGLFAGRQLSGSARTIAGQKTSLQEWGGSSWSSVGSYTTHDDEWTFTQYGDVTLAARIDQKIQASSSGSFSDVDAGAPKAKYLASASGFVIAANYDSGGAVEDGWYCSALYDHTDWATSVSTQCANGRLFDTPGPITGVFKLGDDLIFFKRDSMYHARYVGPPIIWEITLISSSIGCSSPNGAADIGGRLVFCNDSDIYIYDGSSLPMSIAEGIRNHWRDTVVSSYASKMIARNDPSNLRVFIWAVSGDGIATGYPDRYFVWNYHANSWGEGTLQVEGVILDESSEINYSEGSALFATYASVSSGLTYSSPEGSITSGTGMVICKSDHALYDLNGTPGSASLTTGDNGDLNQFFLWRRLKPRYSTTPTTATLTPYSRDFLDDSLSAGDDVDQSSARRFDLLKSGRFHRAKITTTGDCEITALQFDLARQGVE